MSTVPRLPSADGAAPSFLSVLGHAPAVRDAFWDLYARLWSTGDVDHVTRELVRLRNARVTDCGYCRNVRFSVAADEGSEAADADPDERQRAALALADAFLFAGPRPPDVDTAFDAGERAELALSLALFLGMAKSLIALGLEPESMPVTVVPTPGAAR